MRRRGSGRYRQAGGVPGVTIRVGAQHGWQQPDAPRYDRAVSPVRLRPAHLVREHRDFMTEHHDLGIFGRVAAAQ
jgi:hypothetical protein